MPQANETLPPREGLSIRNGHLCMNGQDVPALAEKYGTPLYLVNETVVRNACRRYLTAIRQHYGENSMVAFAGKAMCVSAMYPLLREEGMAADVVSGGELYTARHAGFPMERVFFHGNNKTDAELRLALESALGYFVLDNEDEMQRLSALAEEMGKRPRVLLRVTPGVEAHTHSYIQTGQIDSKFGAILENGEALALIGKLSACTHLEYAGLHCHIGSQILDAEPFAHTAEVMVGLMAEAAAKFGVTTRILNLGGGYGIRYTDEAPLSPDAGLAQTAAALKAALAAHHLPQPTLVIEPGRSIVSNAGITVYRVGHIKEIPGVRTYVSVDGGMTDNPRYILYGAKYEFLLPEKADRPRTMTATIAGRCCESGDLLGENVPIQPARPGDLLCTLDTGAYCYSMSSHYNRVPGAAMVFVGDESERLVVRRETFEDMIARDIL